MPRSRLLFALFLLTAGCDAANSDSQTTPMPPAVIGSQHDASNVGSIHGRVTWNGPIPSHPLVTVPIFLPTGIEQRNYYHPNQPDISPATRGVQGVVVFLEGIDPAQARPWNLGQVDVEVHEDRIAVIQANAESRVGFVRCGDRVEMVARRSGLHVLSARGAAFFGLALPDADRPQHRTFTQPGIVDLSSAAGKYWHRAYLMVVNHPYYVRTDADGDFRLRDVPPGEYTLKFWLPNDTVVRNERDPNTGLILRYVHARPIESSQHVRVEAGGRIRVDATLSK